MLEPHRCDRRIGEAVQLKKQIPELVFRDLLIDINFVSG